jgi:folate-dependent phosphoribosylglycinamide formyltransferase PurN
LPGDDEETLQKRIQVEEHRLLPDTLARIARGEL